VTDEAVMVVTTTCVVEHAKWLKYL